MNRALLVAVFLLLVPASVFATGTASFAAAQSLLAATSSPGNAYVGGASVVVTAPTAGDLSAVGGSIITAASVAGDELLFAGSISSRAPVAGDLRAIGGSVSIEKPVQGDVVAFGLSVNDAGRAGGSVFIAALNATLSNGASGPVTVYGNNVALAGNFADNVTIVASGRISLAASTTIQGTLSYQAPEPVVLPASVTIGNIQYTKVSYLPDVGTSRALSLMSVGFFLLVRILGALILAGLFAGLFPKLAQAVVDRAYGRKPRSILLSLLLGFGVLVATPILLIVLMLTFVGIGLALLLFVAYALIVFLSLIYAGILIGGVCARRYARRRVVLWRDGVLGMLAFSLVSLIPIVGLIISTLLILFTAGALLIIFFNFAFSGEDTSEML
jgi:hypothetical protein